MLPPVSLISQNHLKTKAWWALPYTQTSLPLLPVCHNDFAKAIPQWSKSRWICHRVQKEEWRGGRVVSLLSSPLGAPKGGAASGTGAQLQPGLCCSRHGSSQLISQTQKQLLLLNFWKHSRDSWELQGKPKFSIGNSLAVHTLLFTW